MSGDLKLEVEEANAAFYRALESNEIERMDVVWAHEAWVGCVHPGWDMVRGWARVRDSWEMIFKSGQRLRASPSSVSIELSGDFAWVTCTESLTVFNDESFDSAQAVATNLFVRRQSGWLMIHHHASPIPMIVADVSSDLVQ
jgi:ketosteroid isomerase-like protein